MEPATEPVVEPLLELRGVSYSTPEGRLLVERLDLKLFPGQMLLVSGPNGSGKSTLLKVLLRRARVGRGEVILRVPEEKIAYIPQLDNTDVHLPFTLRDVLEMSTEKLDMDHVRRIRLVSAAQLESAWNTASGGERKRTLLTRALLPEPRLLFFDEPMNHLDAASRSAVVHALKDFLSDSQKRAVVMVSHKGLHAEELGGFDVVPLDFSSLGGRAWVGGRI